MRCLKNFPALFSFTMSPEKGPNLQGKKSRNNAGHVHPVITPALVVALGPGGQSVMCVKDAGIDPFT